MTMRLGQLFSAPSGWENARVSIFGSLAFFAIYAFSEFLANGGMIEMLVIGAAVGTSGVAETLPEGQWRAASVLRLLALGMLVAVLVTSLLSLVSSLLSLVS